MKILTLIFALALVGCSTTLSPECKLSRDLLGHTTGSGESAWLFRAGQIKHVEILWDSGDRVLAGVIVQSAETGEKYFLRIQIDYFFCLSHCHERIETVGLLYIRKL